MRQFSVLVLILFVSFNRVTGQVSKRLSANAEISIMTMGPYYKELYAAFGHSAIRVYDPVNGINFAYNYGTFDFNQPNFYLNFARGNLLYQLSVQPYKGLVQYIINYNRFIHEQILDLSPDQKQQVFDYLQNNALPENASYNYDYFYDNCATRIRDVFVETLGYSIRFESSHITSDRTIRELCDDYLTGHYPWGNLGIDLCLGLPMDKVLTPVEYMFLPDYVELAFDHGWIKTEDGEKPIVKRKEIIFDPGKTDNGKTWLTPSLVFLLFLVAVAFITRSQKKRKKKGRYLDLSMFIMVGLLGIFLALLWFATDHKAAAGNMNLIWAFPVHFVAGFALMKENSGSFWKKYFRVTTVILAILLLSWPILPQMIPTSLMFIVAAIMLRSGYIGWGRAYDNNNSKRE